MGHTSVRGKCLELALVPEIAHNLQLILLLGQLSVNYHQWGESGCLSQMCWSFFSSDVMVFLQLSTW